MKLLHSTLIAFAATLPCRADYQILSCTMEVPQQRLAELMAAGKSGDEIFTALRAEVDWGRGTTVDISSTRLKKEEKALLESIGAVISPLWLEVSYSPITDSTPKPSKQEDFRLTSPVTSFETKNTGISWELEISASGDGTVSLSSTWTFCRALPVTKVFDWKDEAGDSHSFSYPHYKVVKVPANLTLKPGRWTLVSTQSSSANGNVDPSRKWVSFVRVDDLDATKS